MNKKLQINFKSLFLISILFLLIIPSINTCQAQKTPRILFDESGPYGGNGYTMYNLGEVGVSTFANLLEKNGFEVSKLAYGPITAEELRGYDVLILMGPGRNYTDSEINAIHQFVNNGGGLFLLGSNWGEVDGDENFAFNKIARSFGVDFSFNQIVTDLEHNFVMQNYVLIKDIRTSPITTNVPEFYYLMGSYISNPGDSTVIAFTDNDSWGDVGFTTTEGYTMSNYQKDPNEQGGPLAVISTLEYGEGKVVFMGAAGTFVNPYIYRDNGWILGLNSVNWLSNQPIPSSYQKASLFSFTTGEMEYKIAEVVFLALVILLGLFLIIRRDKQKVEVQTFKIIKKWKYYSLIVINVVSVLLAGLLFFPINFYLFDTGLAAFYDPYLGFTLIITGILDLCIMGAILFNIIVRQRMVAKFSYFNIGLILFFAGFTYLWMDVFPFPYTWILGMISVLLFVAPAINLLINRSYGPDLIIEGKEFERLKRVSAKSLPYELHSLYKNPLFIGEGGFGRVWKVERLDGTEVAVKIPKTFDKKSEETFITEVSNWIKLDHPNIVKLYEFRILPIPFIEMEYCEMKLDHGKKPLKEAISIVYQVAKGLQYAHNKNIIHGDVKTSNIMIKNSVYKISDWGLSKLKIDGSVTILGATPSYAAPEQISIEFGKADERTDIYQLGNVFYEMVTGQLPFEGEISQIYHSILKNQPTIPSRINEKAINVDKIIMKCLNKDKNDRYSSMAELISDLEKLLPTDETIVFKK